jgi:hypothetical protein
MATKTCTVSFVGPSGVCHSVDVSADSLYEAAIGGFSLLKQDGWADPIAPGRRTTWDKCLRPLSQANSRS